MTGTAAVSDLVKGRRAVIISSAGVERARSKNPEAISVVSASYGGHLHDRERYPA